MTISQRLDKVEDAMLKQGIGVNKRPGVIFFKRENGVPLYQINRGNGNEWVSEEVADEYLASFEESDSLTIFKPTIIFDLTYS
jgi:hypothetical protein